MPHYVLNNNRAGNPVSGTVSSTRRSSATQFKTRGGSFRNISYSSLGMSETIRTTNSNDIGQEFLYLCVHRFVRVPVALIYSCYQGKPKISKIYPASRETELRARSCKYRSLQGLLYIISDNIKGWYHAVQRIVAEGKAGLH